MLPARRGLAFAASAVLPQEPYRTGLVSHPAPKVNATGPVVHFPAMGVDRVDCKWKGLHEPGGGKADADRETKAPGRMGDRGLPSESNDSMLWHAQTSAEASGPCDPEGVGALVVLAEVEAHDLLLVLDPKTDHQVYDLEQNQ